MITSGHDIPGTYRDTFVTVRGCDSIRILHVEGMSFFIPNVFSPNDDGINDIFSIAAHPQNLQIQYFAIFDRAGNMMYETDNWPVAWKGVDKNNKACLPAVYPYILKYSCASKSLVEHGNVTLLR